MATDHCHDKCNVHRVEYYMFSFKKNRNMSLSVSFLSVQLHLLALTLGEQSK